MLPILLIIALGVAGYFGVRYFLLVKSLNEVSNELYEVTDSLGESRIVKLPRPDKNAEVLLETINLMLAEIRKEAVEHGRRETALKSQIESISHDLRTPLTSIQGYLSLIETSKLDSESIEALEVVTRKADSLQRLITQFYELSQLEYAGDSHDLGAHDVGGVLRETLAAHYQMLSTNNLEVVLAMPEESIEVLADPDTLERIFANLIENASRYALSKLKVEVRTNAEQAQVVFSNDCDLAEEVDPEELFTPFYVGHSSRPQGSSGLGLAIARQLAKGMNARLEGTLDRSENSQSISITLTLQRWPNRVKQL